MVTNSKTRAKAISTLVARTSSISKCNSRISNSNRASSMPNRIKMSNRQSNTMCSNKVHHLKCRWMRQMEWMVKINFRVRTFSSNNSSQGHNHKPWVSSSTSSNSRHKWWLSTSRTRWWWLMHTYSRFWISKTQAFYRSKGKMKFTFQLTNRLISWSLFMTNCSTK